jgi:hypothetical protein
MSFSVDGLTVEDFTQSGWRDVIESVTERTCLYYRSAFYTQSSEARDRGDPKLASLFDMLGGLASMFIDLHDSAEPLKPMLQGPDGHTPIPRDFDPAADYLSEILIHIDDAELRARVADVLWLRKRDFKAAREAAASYLAAAQLDDPLEWSEAMVRIERALDLATQTNQRDLIEQISDRIEKKLATCDLADASPLALRLMTVLQERKVGDPAEYACKAEQRALAAEARGDWYVARRYATLQADWHRMANEDDKALKARLRSAETFVQEAEARIASADGQGYSLATHFIESAIHALRNIGGQQEQVAQLHRRLLDYQRNAILEMKAISHEVDASEMIAAATKAVGGKRLYDAIFGLALLGQPARMATLRKQAEWQLQNSIRALIPMTYKNGMGRTVARRDPPELGETTEEADLRVEMYSVASLGHTLHVIGYVEPARAQILREHEIKDDDLMGIVRDNPFVPPGREGFFVRGLHAGFNGDFVVAAHLLVPQIENSVRYLLEQLDIVTSGLDDEGIQDERDLNRTLRLSEFTVPLTEVLGEDMLFDLRGLLIERYGSNLRNDVAHGLLDYNAFNTPPCAYLWWLTLRLCCMPVLSAIHGQSEHSSSQDDQARTQDEKDTEPHEAPVATK